MGRSQERGRNHINADTPLGRALLELYECIDRWITHFLILDFRNAANVLYAMAGEELQALVRSRPALAPQLNQRAFAATGRLSRNLTGKASVLASQQHAHRGRKDKVSAV